MKDQLGQLKEYCDEAGRDFGAMDISVIVISTAFGIDAADPASVANADKALDLAAEYE